MRTSALRATALFSLLAFAGAASVARADAGDPYPLRIVLDLGSSRSVLADHTATVTSRFGACDVSVIRSNGTLYHTFGARDEMRGFALEAGDEIKFVKGTGNCAISLVVYAKADPGDRFPAGRY